MYREYVTLVNCKRDFYNVMYKSILEMHRWSDKGLSVVKDMWQTERVTFVTQQPRMTERGNVHDNDAYLYRLKYDLLHIQAL